MRMSELHAEQSDEVALLWDEIRRMEARLKATVTPRDQFAMAALTGLMAISPAKQSLEGIAEFSYIAADAMLKAREAK